MIGLHIDGHNLAALAITAVHDCLAQQCAELRAMTQKGSQPGSQIYTMLALPAALFQLWLPVLIYVGAGSRC